MKKINSEKILAGYLPGREEYFAAIGHLLREAASNNSVSTEELSQMEKIAEKMRESRSFRARNKVVVSATIFWWVAAKSPQAKKFWRQKEIAKIFGVSEVAMRNALRQIKPIAQS